MSLLGRARRVFGDSVGALLAPAEDPRQSFAHAYQNQRGLLAKVRAALAELASTRTGLEARVEALRSALPALEEAAHSEVVAGREQAARVILRRLEQNRAAAASIEAEVARVRLEEQSLSLIEQRLATQIEAFYARQEVLAARFSAADAQVRINEALGGVSLELADLGLALEQAEESADVMRARAGALSELAEIGVLPELAPEAGATDPELEAAVELRLAQITAQYRRPSGGGKPGRFGP